MPQLVQKLKNKRNKLVVRICNIQAELEKKKIVKAQLLFSVKHVQTQLKHIKIHSRQSKAMLKRLCDKLENTEQDILWAEFEDEVHI